MSGQTAPRVLGRADAALALSLVAMFAMLLLPMPTWVVDLGVAANLTLALVLLGSALYVRAPLTFSSFPTLLLLSTLFRLALNVTSTRLILLHADAGRVIEAFGHVVVQGDYAVGALVFAMLTAVQMLVVARGAERIAEVSARFSLDALPGKQLAIEAELRAGQLGSTEVRRARAQLSQESELLGALDGAMKFVKGDAVAGLVIAAINAFGGLGIGTLRRGLGFAESAQRYGLLAIGDALASQLPSLLSAIAAGLLVTRMASRDTGASLAQTIARELFGDPRGLGVAAVGLGVLAAAPGVPAAPFALLAATSGGLAFRALRRLGRAAAAVDGLVLHLGAAQSLQKASLQPALAEVRASLAEELGLPLPAVLVRLDAGLATAERAWRWRGRTLHLASATAQDTATLCAELALLLRREARALVDLDSVGTALDGLAHTAPRLVRELVPSHITLPDLTELCRGLVEEGIGLGSLKPLLIGLSRALPLPDTKAARLGLARRALRTQISARLAPAGELHLLSLAPELEEAIADALHEQEGGPVLALAPSLASDIRASIRSAFSAADPRTALLTSAEIRAHVRSLMREEMPDLQVICPDEISPGIRIKRGSPIGP
jgi:type III secretion protein V